MSLQFARDLRSRVTAKGDVLAATAAGVLTPVPVGAAGSSLQADASQAAGMKWGTVDPAAWRLWRRTGSVSESLGLRFVPTANGSPLLSGRLHLAGCFVLPAGVPINNITFQSATTAAGTPLNQWFCLVDQAMNVLGKTADDTTAAWNANTRKTLPLSATYTPTNEIAVYAGILVVATTVPTIVAVNALGNVLAGAPVIAGTSTTGLTTPASLGATATAITAGTQLPWCDVS